MSKSICCAAGLAAALLAAPPARASIVEVTGGQTSVLLDTDTLESAAGLTLSGVSAEVIAPGSLGPSSVAFAVNAPNALPPTLPTTFSYDPADFLGTFAGTIEHTGSVFFDSMLGAVEVGDFTIGFDAARAGGLGGLASGFFVESTTGIEAILFDIAAPSKLSATDRELRIGADLLVSSEFAGFLLGSGLASADLSGADVGDALVEGVVPAPGAALALIGGLLAAPRRRRA